MVVSDHLLHGVGGNGCCIGVGVCVVFAVKDIFRAVMAMSVCALSSISFKCAWSIGVIYWLIAFWVDSVTACSMVSSCRVSSV